MKGKSIAVTLIMMLIVSMLTGCGNQKEAAEFDDLVGTPTDYSDSDNWMKLPKKAKYDTDVIFLYPSSYMDEDGEDIGSVDDKSMRENATSAYEQMGSVFEGVSNVYVPYYRQFNIARFSDTSSEDIKAAGYKEPRTDLYAMLDYYFENLNDGRPYILSGHSQGSNQLEIILDEYMEVHPEYYKNMICAYMLGNSLTESLLKDNSHLKAATGESDTGVIVSWNTEGPGNSDSGETLVVRKGSIAINPLTWKTDDSYADVSLNHGSLVPDENEENVIGDGIADAKLDLERGTVVCTSVDPDKYAIQGFSDVFGPESYHGHDYSFYYVNIQENAKKRIEAWFEAKK